MQKERIISMPFFDEDEEEVNKEWENNVYKKR